MKVLIACEESQSITKEFRNLGHEAFSCDILPCSGGHPEWHYQQDVFEVIDQGWDMMIAHPPCTYLSVSGARWLYNKDGSKNEERWRNQSEALNFVQRLLVRVREWFLKAVKATRNGTLRLCQTQKPQKKGEI